MSRHLTCRGRVAGTMSAFGGRRGVTSRDHTEKDAGGEGRVSGLA